MTRASIGRAVCGAAMAVALAACSSSAAPKSSPTTRPPTSSSTSRVHASSTTSSEVKTYGSTTTTTSGAGYGVDTQELTQISDELGGLQSLLNQTSIDFKTGSGEG